MELVAIVTGLLLLQVFWFSFQVGQARVKYDCPAPAMSGAPEFERMCRVHQNSIEQLVIFVPSMWMFAYFVQAEIAAGLGLLFIVGRQIYRSTYVSDPSSRSKGFVIGVLAMAVLLIGSMIGAGISFF